jgi:hypothetical protein
MEVAAQKVDESKVEKKKVKKKIGRREFELQKLDEEAPAIEPLEFPSIFTLLAQKKETKNYQNLRFLCENHIQANTIYKVPLRMESQMVYVYP